MDFEVWSSNFSLARSLARNAEKNEEKIFTNLAWY